MDRNADHFDCRKCTNKYCTAEPDEAWPDSRGPAGFKIYEVRSVGEFDVCLKPMISAESRALLRLYGHYQAGHLPLAGGILDQPAPFLAAVDVIRGALAHGD